MFDPANPPEAYLFDMGNVLIDIDVDLAFEHWSAVTAVDKDTLRERFVMDEAYRAYEVGKIDTHEYLKSLRRSMHIDIDSGDLLAGWNAILLDELPGIHALLERLREVAPIYVFSNTNAAHQKLWSVKLAHILELSEAVFTSWEIGLRKPDVESFLHVAEQIQMAPENILFFDDAIENIDGAQAAGMRTVHVTGFDDTIQAVSPYLSATV